MIICIFFFGSCLAVHGVFITEMHGPEFFVYLFFSSSFGIGPCVLCDDRQGGTMGYNIYIIPRSHLVYFGTSRFITGQPGGRVEEPLHSEKTSLVALFVR